MKNASKSKPDTAGKKTETRMKSLKFDLIESCLQDFAVCEANLNTLTARRAELKAESSSLLQQRETVLSGEGDILEIGKRALEIDSTAAVFTRRIDSAAADIAVAVTEFFEAAEKLSAAVENACGLMIQCLVRTLNYRGIAMLREFKLHPRIHDVTLRETVRGWTWHAEDVRVLKGAQEGVSWNAPLTLEKAVHVGEGARRAMAVLKRLEPAVDFSLENAPDMPPLPEPEAELKDDAPESVPAAA